MSGIQSSTLLRKTRLDGSILSKWRPQRDSNPRRRRERAVSWARLDDGDRTLKKLVSRAGFEPATRTLKVYCSTN